jgi:N-acetylglutamate synthase/N-acetylornithine aminotransferase
VSVTGPKGFVASGIAAGVKANGDLDLALVATDDGRPVPACESAVARAISKSGCDAARRSSSAPV